MTLAHKNWLKNEVLRMFLSGESQEAIASQLKVSVGTVNNIIDEILKSDDTAALQRQIAIVAKKERVSIPQIAANLRYKNLIKLNMLDERKSEKFLNALDMLFNKYSIAPSDAANQFFSIIELMLRENTEPHKLEEIIKSEVSELREKQRRNNAKTKLLEDTDARLDKEIERLRTKEKILNAFVQTLNMLGLYDYREISSEYATVAKALIDMKKMGYDPKAIGSSYEKFESLTKEKERLEKRLQEYEKVLRYYNRKSEEEKIRRKDNGVALQIFTRLIKNGLKEEDIFVVANILKNDFPESAIEELQGYLRDYGSMSAALLKKKREYESETDSFFEER